MDVKREGQFERTLDMIGTNEGEFILEKYYLKSYEDDYNYCV